MDGASGSGLVSVAAEAGRKFKVMVQGLIPKASATEDALRQARPRLLHCLQATVQAAHGVASPLLMHWCSAPPDMHTVQCLQAVAAIGTSPAPSITPRSPQLGRLLDDSEDSPKPVGGCACLGANLTARAGGSSQHGWGCGCWPHVHVLTCCAWCIQCLQAPATTAEPDAAAAEAAAVLATQRERRKRMQSQQSLAAIAGTADVPAKEGAAAAGARGVGAAVRRCAVRVSTHPDFEHVVMLLILGNCFTLAMYKPLQPHDSTWNGALGTTGGHLGRMQGSKTRAGFACHGAAAQPSSANPFA